MTRRITAWLQAADDADEAEMTTARRWRTACLLGVGTLALYAATAGGSLTSTDAVVSFDLTRSIVEDHSIALSGNLLGLEANRGVDGRFYSQYGIGQSIYNVPFYVAGTVAQRLIHRRIGKPDTFPKAAVALGSAVAAAGAVLLVWLLSWRLAATSRAAHRRGLERGDRVAALAVFEIRVLDAAHRGRSAGQRVSPARRGRREAAQDERRRPVQSSHSDG